MGQREISPRISGSTSPLGHLSRFSGAQRSPGTIDSHHLWVWKGCNCGSPSLRLISSSPPIAARARAKVGKSGGWRGVGERGGREKNKIIRKPPLPSATALLTGRLPTELHCRPAGKHIITENTVSKGIFQALTAHKLQFVDFFLGLDLN